VRCPVSVVEVDSSAGSPATIHNVTCYGSHSP
jgi:hypothetical protein